MSSYFADIRAALEATLDDLGLTVAWENVEYKPLQKNPFIRASLLPVETVPGSLGEDGRDVNRGIFQCEVMLPIGESPVSTLPDQIGDAFRRGSVHSYNGTRVRVRSVTQVAARTEGAWFAVPVDVRYFSYTGARSA